MSSKRRARSAAVYPADIAQLVRGRILLLTQRFFVVSLEGSINFECSNNILSNQITFTILYVKDTDP